MRNKTIFACCFLAFFPLRPSDIDYLPDEIIIEIASHLPSQDIFFLSLSSKHINNVLNSHIFPAQEKQLLFKIKTKYLDYILLNGEIIFFIDADNTTHEKPKKNKKSIIRKKSKNSGAYIRKYNKHFNSFYGKNIHQFPSISSFKLEGFIDDGNKKPKLSCQALMKPRWNENILVYWPSLSVHQLHWSYRKKDKVFNKPGFFKFTSKNTHNNSSQHEKYFLICNQIICINKKDNKIIFPDHVERLEYFSEAKSNGEDAIAIIHRHQEKIIIRIYNFTANIWEKTDIFADDISAKIFYLDDYGLVGQNILFAWTTKKEQGNDHKVMMLKYNFKEKIIKKTYHIADISCSYTKNLTLKVDGGLAIIAIPYVEKDSHYQEVFAVNH